MRALSIQVQPDRVPDLDLGEVKRLFGEIKVSSLVDKSAFDEGMDQIRYLNFTFGTDDAKSLWKEIQRILYENGTVGEGLARCSMAMCSSEEGWDDYILLHHFDASVPLERFE